MMREPSDMLPIGSLFCGDMGGWVEVCAGSYLAVVFGGLEILFPAHFPITQVSSLVDWHEYFYN